MSPHPRRRAIHVGPHRNPDIVSAVESAGGVVVDEPGAAGAAVILTGDQEYVERILASGVEWVQLPWAGIDHWELTTPAGVERRYTSAGPAYARAVAEHAVAAALALHKGLPTAARATTWERNYQTRGLTGTSVLLVGTGRIAASAAELLEPWDVTLYGLNRSGRPFPGAEETYRLDDTRADLSVASLVICSLPLTPQTEGVLDTSFFDRLGQDAFFVNVGRGAVVDTDALVAALQSGRLAGAALDVTDPEPLPDGHPLWGMDRVLITPHVANPPGYAAPGLAELVADNVARWLADRPLRGLVDPEQGY